MTTPHLPVMLNEVLEVMVPSDGETYVDGTFGAGGYSRALLESADCQVIGIDRDPLAQRFAAPLLAEYPGRFRLIQGCFGDVAALLEAENVGRVNGFVLDIGVSSMQLDQAERGFSFKQDGPLDMRMAAGEAGICGDSAGQTAAVIVNSTPEKELADILYLYGEERASRRIARAICEARKERQITGTVQLAEIIRQSAGYAPDAGIDPATRSFQALRIVVNDELGELEKALDAAETILQPEGRLVVVSFHSLEDRIVKRFLQERSKHPPAGSRHQPVQAMLNRGWFKPISRKALMASEQEARLNPRARSAKLRAAAYHPEGGRV